MEMTEGYTQPKTDGHLQEIEDGIRNQLNPDDIEDVDKIVQSGMQLLYSKETRKDVMNSLRDVDSDSDPIKVAMGINGLLGLINKEAEKIPADLMVPSGVLLIVELLRFMSESGMAEEDGVLTGNVVEEFLAIVMQKMGFTPEDFTGGKPVEDPNGFSGPPGAVPPAPGGLVGAA